MKRLYILPVSLLALTLISALALSSVKVSADNTDVVDNIAITVPQSCTMTGTGTDSHTATINPGTYNSSIGLTTIKAFCNDNEGFSIYAIGYTDEEDGKNVLTSSALGSTSDIATSTATSGNNSAWAMKLAVPQSPTPTYPMTIQSDTEGSFSSFHTVPDDYTLVAKRTSSTDIGQNAEGSSLTTTYQAYISQTQPAGTYTGKVKYTMVHPHDAEAPIKPVVTDPNKISYNPNAPGVTDTMGDQSITSSDTSANLWASNFQRSGYGFAGWSETHDYSDPTKFHGPNETIEFTAGQYSERGLSLYAIWVPSAGDLQNWTGCSSLAQGAVTALTDQRDNQTYAVAKLADSKCWMIENLRLNTSGSNDESKSQGFGGVFAGLANPETANFGNTVSNSLYSIDGSTSITISGSNQNYLFPRYNNQNTASPVSNMTAWDNTQNVYSIGNWYTWSAALANTNAYTGPTAEVDGKTSETANTSICPSGWRLPYGRNTGNGNTPGGFYYLNYKINNDQNITNATASNKLRAYPNNFIFSGQFYNSSSFNRASRGYYWPSTTLDNTASYYIGLRSTYIVAGTGGVLKDNGQSVRCVANS